MIRLRIRELLSCVGIVSLSIVGAPVCADEPEPLGVVTLQSSTEIIGDGADLAVDPGGTIDSEMRAGAAINQVLMNWNGFPTIAARGPFCGDGIVNGDETCDDGNDIDDDTCRNDCSFCGDFVVNPEDGETCDPPLTVNGELVQDGGFEAGPFAGFWMENSTNFDRAIYAPEPFEGMFHVWIGGSDGAFEEGGVEQVVMLPLDFSFGLSFQLFLATCSGETTDTFEVTVDGNVVFSIDMTDQLCDVHDYERIEIDLRAYAAGTVNLRFHGVTATTGVPSSIFIDNVSLFLLSTVECRPDCTSCGDGIINGGELCDFNDPAGPSNCSDECEFDDPFCGDAIISPGETCEPRGAPAGASGNECRYDCTVCGDGEVHPEEFCDDGNNIDEDGCRNDCTACGDGVVDPTFNETCDPPGQPVGSGNLVLDGSFEAGTPNPFWTESSTIFDSPLCDPASCGFDLAADGAWWTWFGGTSAEEAAIVSQPIALPEGASATLQFALWLITCSGETSDFFEVKVNDDVVFTVDLADPSCDSAGYTLKTVDLSAYAGQGIVLEFHGVTGSTGAPGNIFLDLVSLQVFGENVCRADCTVCGDGVVDSGEACDDGNDIDSDMCRNDCTENPLLVELKSFTADVVKSGVLLRWSTYSERETLGFRLWRSGPTPTAGRSRTVETALHTGMIFGRGSEIEGAEYRFLDNAPLKPGTYVYYLEDVDNFGVITRHDPVSVEIE